MRKFTDIFIERPVLATVVSLTLLVLGLRSIGLLPVLQYPRTQNAVVTVTTTYFGADPSLVAGFITTPLENSIAQANGIDFMSSASRQSVSTITAALRLNYDVDKALTEINTKVNAVLNQLPPGSQQPVLTVKVGQQFAAMYIGFASDVLTPNKITDYLIRVVQPKLQAVEGVQTAEILGGLHAFYRLQLGLNDANQVIGDLVGREHVARETDVHGGELLADFHRKHRLLRARRQLVQNGVDLGIDLGKGLVDVVVEAQGGRDRAHALAACRAHEVDAVRLGDGVFERRGDESGHQRRVGPEIGRGHGDDRVLRARILQHRQEPYRA